MSETAVLKIGASRFLIGEETVNLLGEEIIRYGSKILCVGGKTTLPMIRSKVEGDFKDKGIRAVWVTMEEPNSVDYAERLKQAAQEQDVDVIVAVGGGKCMDLCKVTSDRAKKPLITVPTSVATCAGASAVSIMYTKENGSYDCSIPKEKEVDCVIADLTIIGESPRRLFASGIMDSIAKLPEIVNGREKMSYPEVNIYKHMAYINSQFIYEFLTRYGLEIYENPMKNKTLLRDVTLINLIITSMVSGFSSGSDQLAVAHGLYDGMRKFFPVESKNALHGEIVAVGILMQMVFNNDSGEEYKKIYEMMKKMNMPLKLIDLGVEPTQENLEKLKEYNMMKNSITEKGEIERLEKAFLAIV
ncbi:iron-containing alcohol dehydrogenase [Ruminococcus sp. CLA-AA-H200]|uniref:Glycerol dehydrogenase n=1 Tax=Ruminococcus turbiniformis TaxID=2881258 RepID=A0ABS8G3U5_9FIRM|nr:iron-containing alcohol dehydrogenase [Ruminococcus turbiniformis]MCC2256258.1 iron-containing alcohol dehydrogenase [Ruminococcus turbiniformis]